jgi:hypothetical protein
MNSCNGTAYIKTTSQSGNQEYIKLLAAAHDFLFCPSTFGLSSLFPRFFWRSMSIHRNMYLALIASLFLSTIAFTIERRDGKPNFPYDDKTTKDCTWWVDYDRSQDCVQLIEENWATLENFRRWVRCIGLNRGPAVILLYTESYGWTQLLRFDKWEVILRRSSL